MNGRELKEGLGRLTRGQHVRSFTHKFLPPSLFLHIQSLFSFSSSITILPSKKTNPKTQDGQRVAPIGPSGIHIHLNSIPYPPLPPLKPQSYNHKSNLFIPHGPYNTRETLGLISLKAPFPIGRPSISPHTNCWNQRYYYYVPGNFRSRSEWF